MAETDSIVGIYGAIDDAVQQDRAARERLAEVLPQYRNPELHWYDDFKEWLAEGYGAAGGGDAAVAPGAVADFPDPESALNQLSQTAPKGRRLARRMFTISVAARVFPEMRDIESGLSRAAIGALRGPSPDTEDNRPVELYRLLSGVDPVETPDAALPQDGWSGIVETAAAKGAIPDTIGMFPRPCTARLVTVPGITGPVATLLTETPVDGIDFDAATRFIEPVNWETCMPDFWCKVTPIPGRTVSPGQRVYREVVSTHCDDEAKVGFWAETELLFSFMWLPDRKGAEVAIANYELADPRPKPRARILVDEGTIVVAKVGDVPTKLRVTTTKRIKFSHPFMFEAIPVIMCAFGYADVAGGLLACAARYGKDVGADGETAPAGTDFPGVPASIAAEAGARPRPGYAAGAPGGYGRTAAGGFLQDSVNIWARALRDSAAAFERGAGAARKGNAGKNPSESGG
jgi:hypothetical protein